MKMMEIFYLLIIFNVFMSVFGGLRLANGDALMTPSPGSSEGGTTGLYTFYTLMLTLVFGLGTYYAASMLPGVNSNSRTPMTAIYGVAIVFHISYFASFTTFWEPIVSVAPQIGAFYLLFTFIIEMVFAIGFIQMTTGGWGLYK